MTGLPAGLELVRARALTVGPIEAWFPMEPGDRPLVTAGEAVVAGAPLTDRLRDPRTEVVAGPVEADAEPGTWWAGDPSRGRRGPASRVRGELLFRSARRWRVAAGDPGEPLVAPFAGVVGVVRSGIGLSIRTPARGLLGVDVIGDATTGRLDIVAPRDGYVRASEIDIRAADSILVAGAHIDAEAITRARAVGVRGIVVAGLGIKERREIVASERRARASVHALSPFAVLVLEGAIGRPIAPAMMTMLEALQGLSVAIIAEPACLVVEDPKVGLPKPAPGRVGIAAGPLAGVEGAWGGLAGQIRCAGGAFLEAGYVLLDGRGPIAVPLGDLERYA